ncbi:MAG: branched-chain amino acid ABC transporter permease [Nitrospirae bacterium]|nr:branched-chain amino acid ABC transporter permease [Nitrospirota bacterium]
MFIQLLLNGIIAGAVYTLIALGFNLMYWTGKFFNAAYGAIAVTGAYAVLFLYKKSGMNIFVSVLAGVAFAGALGMLADKIVFMPLRKRKASAVIMFVASLGLFTVIQAAIAMLFSSDFQILTDTFAPEKTLEIFGGVVTEINILILTSGLLILAALHFVLSKTLFGKAVKAIGDDNEVAKIIGIHTDRIIGYVFFIGSAISGLAGILIGFDLGIKPTMGMDLLLKGVTTSIIGGAGNIYGGVLGAFLLGLAENFGVWKISGEWKDAIAFGLLIIFLVFRPRGILGT